MFFLTPSFKEQKDCQKKCKNGDLVFFLMVLIYILPYDIVFCLP